MISIYENSEFILRTTVGSEICPSALGKKKPRITNPNAGFFGRGLGCLLSGFKGMFPC
jgi:hypothetical protein